MERLALLEYYQWRLTRRVLGIVNDGVHPRHQAGVRKALEVFLLANYSRTAQWPPLYSESLANDKFVRKLESDLVRVGADDAGQRVAAILREVESTMRQKEAGELRIVPVRQTGKILRIGKFSRDYDKRARLLAGVCGIDAVAALALRYSAALAESAQWAVPPEVYEIFRTDLGCLGEGYASPLNSYMLPFRGGVYCSGFPDIDRHFDSRGSLYDLDGASASALADGWVFNPPFTLYHLNRCANHAAQWMRANPQLRIVVIGRSHNTSPTPSHKTTQTTSPYAPLMPYVQATLDLPPSQHHYISSTGQATTAMFPSSLFICGRPLEDASVVPRIRQGFDVPAASRL